MPRSSRLFLPTGRPRLRIPGEECAVGSVHSRVVCGQFEMPIAATTDLQTTSHASPQDSSWQGKESTMTAESS